MSTKRQYLIEATLILAFAAAFRLFLIREVPPGLMRDEVLNADIVSFIRQGKHAFFFAEGYGHEPLYHYLATPFQVLLGDNLLSIRLPSVFMGIIVVAVMSRWVRREYGRVASLVSSGLLAVSWWPVIFSRIGIRSISEPLLLLLMAWFWPRLPLVAGFFLGLSLYTYTAARAFLLLPILLLVWFVILAWRCPEQRERDDYMSQAKTALHVFFVALIISLPLFWTLQLDPSIQERLQQLSGPLDALKKGDAAPVLRMALATLGVFSFTGDPLSSYMIPNLPLFDPFSSIWFHAGVLRAVTKVSKGRYALISAWLGLALIPSAVAPDAASTVRLIGAIPVVYLMPGLTTQWIWKRLLDWKNDAGRQEISLPTMRISRSGATRAISMLFSIGLAAFLFVNLAKTIQNGFVRWPKLLEVRQKYQSTWLDIARHWSSSDRPPPVIADSWYEPIKRDSLIRNMGFDPHARWVQAGRALVFPSGDGPAYFYVPEFSAPNQDLVRFAGLGKLLFRSPDVPSFTLYELPARPQISLLADPIQFGRKVTLLGYEQLPLLEGERHLALVTYWRVDGSLPPDLAFFTHLIDDRDRIVAQYDGMDAMPDTLQIGDRFLQYHELGLPASLPDGDMSVQVGLYTRNDGIRLIHSGEPEDRVILAPFLSAPETGP